MKPLSLCHCVQSLLIIVLIFSDTQVTAQEGPGIVIAHPGQDVELLCNVTVTSTSEAVEWIVDHEGQHGVNALLNNILPGYSTNGNNLIVENIMMNDGRNDSEYRCVIILQSTSTMQRESDLTTLYVAGVPKMISDITARDININGNDVTLTLSWEEPFNNLNPIMSYTVSCSGDVTCPPSFTTTDNTTSYTITNLMPDIHYIFSVVATNSIGSGKAGVVVINIAPDGSTTTTNITTLIESVTATTTTSRTVGSISPSMTIPTTSTSSIETPDPCPTNTMCPSMMSMVDKDETDNNGAVIIAIVVIVVLILCCCIIMNILFCYCSKRKERHDQDNEKDEHSKLVHYSIIILKISTLGTSILLWWLYKELAKHCCGKDKYDVQGQSPVPLSSPKTKKSSHKDKNVSKGPFEYDHVKGEDTSIQGSPSYAATTKAVSGGTQSGPALQYDYARTGAITIGMSNTQQPAPSEPEMEGYAVTDIVSAKDNKNDKKGKVNTKSQHPPQYSAVDKSKKAKKKDDKPKKSELNYMDPGNLEFKEEPHKRPDKSEEIVQYGNVVEAPKYTNIT